MRYISNPSVSPNVEMKSSRYKSSVGGDVISYDVTSWKHFLGYSNVEGGLEWRKTFETNEDKFDRRAGLFCHIRSIDRKYSRARL